MGERVALVDEEMVVHSIRVPRRDSFGRVWVGLAETATAIEMGCQIVQVPNNINVKDKVVITVRKAGE